jgi:Dihydrodipicolinate reductase, C-terminus
MKGLFFTTETQRHGEAQLQFSVPLCLCGEIKSAADTITLRHAARNREGFARGALHAARWIIGKKGVHEFSEALK